MLNILSAGDDECESWSGICSNWAAGIVFSLKFPFVLNYEFI